MKPKSFYLCAATVFLLSACAHDSYDHNSGGTSDTYSTGMSAGQSNPQPAASPTFRPGMNPDDPRDPHFTTRPEPQSSPSTTKP